MAGSMVEANQSQSYLKKTGKVQCLIESWVVVGSEIKDPSHLVLEKEFVPVPSSDRGRDSLEGCEDVWVVCLSMCHDNMASQWVT